MSQFLRKLHYEVPDDWLIMKEVDMLPTFYILPKMKKVSSVAWTNDF